MSNQGHGLLSHSYIGFVRFVLLLGPDIRRAFTGPLVLWFVFARYLLKSGGVALSKGFQLQACIASSPQVWPNHLWRLSSEKDSMAILPLLLFEESNYQLLKNNV